MTEVISKTTDGPDKSIRRYTLLAVFLTIFLDLVGFGMFIPIMPSIARELNASNSQAAYLSALFSLGTLLAVMVLGRISDSVGRRKILIFTITLSIAAQAATGFATQIGSYAVLAFIRFIAGVAAGNISVAQAAIADITPIHERSRSMVVIGLAFGAGFAFGPALGAAITLFFPENPLFPIAMAAVIINAVNLLLVIFKFRETHHRFAPQELASVVAAARWLGGGWSTTQHKSRNLKASQKALLQNHTADAVHSSLRIRGGRNHSATRARRCFYNESIIHLQGILVPWLRCTHSQWWPLPTSPQKIR